MISVSYAVNKDKGYGTPANDYSLVVPERSVRTADLPTTQYVCGHPLYPVGHSVFLYGAPGVGKSFIQQGINHTFAWGKPLGSGETRFAPEVTANVLYIDFEGNPSLVKERSLALTPFGVLASDKGGTPMPTDTDYIFSEGFTGKTFPERLAELEDVLTWKENTSVPYSLVILDTFTMFVGGNSGTKNAYDYDVEAIKALNLLASKFEVCMVLIHHPNKAGEMSGSVGRAGTCSIVAKFEKIDDENAVLKTEKNRVGPAMEFNYYSDRDRIWRLATDVPTKLAVAKGNNKAILALLNQHGVMTKATLVKETGLPEGSIKSALTRMAKTGLVERVEDGWRCTFAPKQEIPAMPVWRTPKRCPQCNFTEDWEWGCPNTRCELHKPENFAGQITYPREGTPTETAPKLQLVTEEPKRSIIPTLALDFSEFEPQEPKKGAIKASMRLMKTSVQRDTARYRPSLFAAQPDVPKAEIWEGRNKWTMEITPGTPLVRLDKNAAYLSAANTKLPIGPLQEDADPLAAILDGRVGYATVSGFDRPLPCGGPFFSRTERDEATITTATLKQVMRFIPDLTITKSYTAPGTEVLLRPWIEVLKEEREKALRDGDTARYAFVKNCYSLTVSTMGDSSANWEIRREDWMHILRSQAYTNVWMKAVQAQAAGITVVKVGNTDEIWIVDSGDWETATYETSRGPQLVFPIGTNLGQWKIKERWNAGEVR